LHAQGVFDDVPLETVELVLEGGSIESDGAGTLLTTASCLLHPQRNPTLDRDTLEQRLAELFGLQRILWLEQGWLAGDDTDGHIDMLARFCNPATIACTVCDDPGDEHYAPLQAMRDELAALRTCEDRPYRLIELPIPAPILDRHGKRLPASYANFLIINDMVLVPLYADPNDAIAITSLASAFSQHEVIGIDCRPLIQQYGSLHCLTMQFPHGVLP
jgi:agmatine/peptidylarginine deiminase